jgi:hypothetical protein
MIHLTVTDIIDNKVLEDDWFDGIIADSHNSFALMVSQADGTYIEVSRYTFNRYSYTCVQSDR